MSNLMFVRLQEFTEKNLTQLMQKHMKIFLMNARIQKM